jgi:hypothetical protein
MFDTTSLSNLFRVRKEVETLDNILESPYVGTYTIIKKEFLNM